MNTSGAVLPTILTVSQARDNLYDIVGEAGKGSRAFMITHMGKPSAVVMPIDDFEGWVETLDILSNKKLMKQIRQGEKDLKAGKTHKLEDVIKELGLNDD